MKSGCPPPSRRQQSRLHQQLGPKAEPSPESDGAEEPETYTFRAFTSYQLAVSQVPRGGRECGALVCGDKQNNVTRLNGGADIAQLHRAAWPNGDGQKPGGSGPAGRRHGDAV